jgi:hypothetical protein
MADRIPVEKMDAVDRQQQEEIESSRRLAMAAIFTSVLVNILFFGAFVMAMYEMGKAIEALSK